MAFLMSVLLEHLGENLHKESNGIKRKSIFPTGFEICPTAVEICAKKMPKNAKFRYFFTLEL